MRTSFFPPSVSNWVRATARESATWERSTPAKGEPRSNAETMASMRCARISESLRARAAVKLGARESPLSTAAEQQKIRDEVYAHQRAQRSREMGEMEM